MYAARLALLSLTCLLGCQNELVPIPGVTFPDGSCPTQPDMATPAAKCAAAKGLPGDVLGDICLDMGKVDKQTLTGEGFNLSATTVNCTGWDISGGQTSTYECYSYWRNGTLQSFAT